MNRKYFEDEDKILAGAAAGGQKSETGTSTTSELTGAEKYSAMQKEYMEKYLDRGAFEYDVNADEIYKTYRDQALKDAEKARRDTVAQAAGLTGGYGSSYATAAGSEAYNDVMSGLESMLPELYEAARARYDNEGNDLLNKATMAGSYAEMLDLANNGGVTSEDEKALWDIEQKLKSTNGLNDFRGENDTDAKIYDEAMRIYAGLKTGSNAKIRDKFVSAEKTHQDYTEDQIRQDLMTWQYKDADGDLVNLTYDEVDYLTNQIMGARTLKMLQNMVTAGGESLQQYITNRENLSPEEMWTALEQFTDKSGAKLTEEQIAYIMQNI